MKTTIVITGSTRGIGFGLAREFLALGCAVVVSGRTQAAVEKAVAALSSSGGIPAAADSVAGIACDTTDAAQVQALWDFAVHRFGRVDIWINNAGVSRGAERLEDIPPESVREVISTNVTGAITGAAVALRGMRTAGRGAIYNMEGLGSDGMKMNGQHLYGLTKYALAYLTDTLALEVRGSGVIVGAIRPGMVMTDLIAGQYADRPAEWKRNRAFLEALSERVETVAPVLARKVLANRRNGVRLRYGGAFSMILKLPKMLAARRAAESGNE